MAPSSWELSRCNSAAASLGCGASPSVWLVDGRSAPLPDTMAPSSTHAVRPVSTLSAGYVTISESPTRRAHAQQSAAAGARGFRCVRPWARSSPSKFSPWIRFVSPHLRLRLRLLRVEGSGYGYHWFHDPPGIQVVIAFLEASNNGGDWAAALVEAIPPRKFREAAEAEAHAAAQRAASAAAKGAADEPGPLASLDANLAKMGVCAASIAQT